MISIFFSGFLIGLAGAGHCLGMCGGLASMLSVGQSSSAFNIVAYNLGRIFSYGLFTLLLASTLQFGLSEYYSAFMLPLRTFAGILLVFMGLYLCGLSRLILRVESIGRYLWRFIQPIAKSFLPIKNPAQALGAGLVWGWLPCGLVYSTVLWATSLGSISLSMVAIFGFAMGTLPTMLLAGFFAKQLKNLWQQFHLKWLFGFLIIIYGLYSIPYFKNLLSNIG
ncbi:sulfite exporter TauE/SafE family protein [Marinomonas fungiae]|uniref:sulfite exporter TauE/SafE family protein n=1 Tax=Marinomonas fungiae TaxID=1137284 RepID=UPI003A8CD725